MSLLLSWSVFVADGHISKVYLHPSEHFLKKVTTALRCNFIPKPDLRPSLLLIYIICPQDYLVTTFPMSPKEENLHFSKHFCMDSWQHLSHTQTCHSSLCCGISSCGDLTHTIYIEWTQRRPLLRKAILSSATGQMRAAGKLSSESFQAVKKDNNDTGYPWRYSQ